MNKEIKDIKGGTILPARYFSEVFDWGIGGVLDENGKFVEESGMGELHRFGGEYEYDEKKCDYLDEAVIYVGPMRTHWGHFLAECSVRFWYLLENQMDCRIVFCGIDFEEGKLSPKLIDIFRLLGIEKEKLLDIRKPTKFKHILIPSPALKYEPFDFAPGKIEEFLTNWGKHIYNWSYTIEFKKTFQSIVQKVDTESLKAAEKIYYTRTGLNKKNEIGEKLIEKIFRENGYMIVSPEKESVETQIALMNSCKIFVSIEGTLAHNIIFAKEKKRQVILQKRIGDNMLQGSLNKCMDIEAESIYVGCRPFGKKFPRGGWDGIYWLRACEALRKWCNENNMWFPRRGEILMADIKNFWRYIQLCGCEMCETAKTQREDSQVLKKVKKYKNIVLYGVNGRCLRWKKQIERKYPQKRLYWVDTNYKAIRKYIQVYSIDDVADIEECIYLIGITSRTAAEEVKRKTLEKGIAEKMVYLF